jgi:hypothetical protein
MSKFLLNLLLQISKAFVYSKIKLLFRKEFFLHFRPNRPSGQLAHPAFWPSRGPFFSIFNRPLLPLPTGPRPLDRPSLPSRPSRPSSSSSRTGAAHVSRHRRPASRRPMDGTDYLRQRKNNGRITPPSFPH